LNSKLKNSIKVLFVFVLVVSGILYVKFFTNNTKLEQKEVFVKIPTGSTFEDVKKIIAPYIATMSSFEFIANRRSYSDNIKPGRFLIRQGMSAFEQVATMRRNVPVDLAFNNQERLENLCERLSAQIEPDTSRLLAAFRDPIFLKENGFEKENVFSMFLPNTYQVYWNISAEKFRDKMLEEYKKFWNQDRINKAEQLDLTPIQVTILASIVHKETAKKSERKTVAGVYLNRLAEGMPLQADPTVIYAVKLRDDDFNQVIKRVLYADLFVSSPYNTYLVTGLPPGPIAMPDVDAIDAVLNAEKHNYLYFCASTEKFGYHVFAATYEQHQINARKYSAWLTNLGTKR
jgi:UPF0755 protein